jgi:rSAM/selenodomain-associated transferase 2
MNAACQVALSVVIPTLNAADVLPAALVRLATARAEGLVGEVIVSDGGSTDRTTEIALADGARVCVGPPGRGLQMARGASAANGRWLLFLHADTRVEDGWQEAVAGFAARRGEGAAAAFTFALDDASPAARRLERLVSWRNRWLGLPYGDQGLLISRHLYDEVGGFEPLPLMEDVDIVRRLGRARLAILPARAITSAVRYRRGGYLRRSSRNLLCLTLWFAGLPPRMIARLYG